MTKAIVRALRTMGDFVATFSRENGTRASDVFGKIQSRVVSGQRIHMLKLLIITDALTAGYSAAADKKRCRAVFRLRPAGTAKGRAGSKPPIPPQKARLAKPDYPTRQGQIRVIGRSISTARTKSRGSCSTVTNRNKYLTASPVGMVATSGNELDLRPN